MCLAVWLSTALRQSSRRTVRARDPVAVLEEGKVLGEVAGVQHGLVSALIIWLPEEDVVTNASVLEPGLLRDVGDPVCMETVLVDGRMGGVVVDVVVAAGEVDVTGNQIHLAQEGHEERRLAGSRGATDDAELTDGEIEVETPELEGLFAAVAGGSLVHSRGRRARREADRGSDGRNGGLVRNVRGNEIRPVGYERHVDGVEGDRLATNAKVIKSPYMPLEFCVSEPNRDLVVVIEPFDPPEAHSGFEDGHEYLRDDIERLLKHSEQHDTCERRGGVKILPGDLCVPIERDDGDEDGARKPKQSESCVEYVDAQKPAQLDLACLHDAALKVAFPGKELDHANPLQQLAHHVDAAVARGHEFFLHGAIFGANPVVKREGDNHDEQAEERRLAQDTVEEGNANGNLERALVEDVDVRRDLGQPVCVHSHEHGGHADVPTAAIVKRLTDDKGIKEAADEHAEDEEVASEGVASLNGLFLPVLDEEEELVEKEGTRVGTEDRGDGGAELEPNGEDVGTVDARRE
ncbi:hypothetical protein BC936DRAFT_148228 [Jimgerdemannia flammicorona]|uniref:Uncharacterized protein n=1 Tax=Jimgerdemannia flammicorona TaxID=994334 RepID=A0A433D3J6_9FUNG|nr:hypothetical protein BC936DRAFT_148228 [Jimgerdemannia flammicorona]